MYYDLVEVFLFSRARSLTTAVSWCHGRAMDKYFRFASRIFLTSMSATPSIESFFKDTYPRVGGIPSRSMEPTHTGRI